jgi:serine/threonine protein kinase
MTGRGNDHVDDSTICSNDSTAKKNIGKYPLSSLLNKAREMVEDTTKDWEITDLKSEERIPKFHRDEIEIAGVLGKGGFFVVSEVKRITRLHNEEEGDDVSGHDESTSRELDDEDYIQGVVQNRKFMERYCLRHGKDPRYAFKTMQEQNLQDPETFLNSVVDMVMEFKFLSSVRHPNIIKMRAAAAGDLYHPNAFIILDKIYDTLTDRIEKWKKKEQGAFNKLFDFQKKREKQFLAKRLLVAFDIASALAYLHDMK